MSKKREERCDSIHCGAYVTHRCVLRDDHIGRCLAWMTQWDGDESVRWTKPLPTPCGHAVAVTSRGGIAFGPRTCELPRGHDGPCEVTL